MKRIVVGILAHVDAGKTTLTEGLLYSSGMIDKLGRVVIPIQYRRELGLCEGSEINLRCCERKIIIVPKEPTCRICGGELKCSCEIALCEGCIQMVKMLK